MKSKPVPFLLQGKNIILVINGKSHTVSKDTHMNYMKIIDALKAQDWDALNDLVEPKKAIVNFGKGYVSIDGDKVSWKGQPFHNALSTRMIEMYQEGFPIDPMVRFMENLLKNPSKRSVDQVYGFLEKNKLPITEDGYFLAYKKVRKDYLDIHSGSISNKIGETVTMDRNLVDDNPDSYCSSGLHFCSESYLASFGSSNDPVMILKISPEDVVSIPTDYNGAKGRCSKYEVIAQVNGDPKDAFSNIVDQEYVKPAPKVKSAKVSSNPAAAWPFPLTTPDVDCETCSADCAACDGNELYDVVRVYGGAIEATSLTLNEAEYKVDSNIRNKKALLKIVISGTDREVE